MMIDLSNLQSLPLSILSGKLRVFGMSGDGPILLNSQGVVSYNFSRNSNIYMPSKIDLSNNS